MRRILQRRRGRANVKLQPCEVQHFVKTTELVDDTNEYKLQVEANSQEEISDAKSVRIFRYARREEKINKTEGIRRMEDKTGAHKVSNGFGNN